MFVERKDLWFSHRVSEGEQSSFAVNPLEHADCTKCGMKGARVKRLIYPLILLVLSVFGAALATTSPEADTLRRGVADPYPSSNPEEFQIRLDLYRKAGIGILRADIGWRGHQSADGTWLDPPTSPLLQLAEKNGLLLKVNIGAMAGPPTWFFDLHSDAQIVNEEGLKSFNVISYWYPDLHSLLEDKDDRIFSYAAKQGILARIAYIIVPNGPAGEPLYPVPWTTTAPQKPMRFWFYDAHARADFREKMKVKYREISMANASWKSTFKSWEEVKIPRPGTSPGQLWRDVLEWYRGAKRNFVTWQVAHYQRLVTKYYPNGNAPRLMLLVAGNHVTRYQLEQAIRSGGGDDSIKMMADSEFLLDLAHQEGMYLQYTGIPNMREVEYLERYMREHHFDVPLWGENAGNSGDPKELDEEVLSNALFGQEYIGSNLVESDHVTPTEQFRSLSRAHAWLASVRARTVASNLSFDHLPIDQGACVYADAGKSIELCMQHDANLVLRRNGEALWASDTSHKEPGFCSKTEDPASSCGATFQGDGNLVVRRGAQVLWSSGTGRRGKQIALSDHSPYLWITSRDGKIVWRAVQ